MNENTETTEAETAEPAEALLEAVKISAAVLFSAVARYCEATGDSSAMDMLRCLALEERPSGV